MHTGSIQNEPPGLYKKLKNQKIKKKIIGKGKQKEFLQKFKHALIPKNLKLKEKISPANHLGHICPFCYHPGVCLSSYIHSGLSLPKTSWEVSHIVEVTHQPNGIIASSTRAHEIPYILQENSNHLMKQNLHKKRRRRERESK